MDTKLNVLETRIRPRPHESGLKKICGFKNVRIGVDMAKTYVGRHFELWERDLVPPDGGNRLSLNDATQFKRWRSRKYSRESRPIDQFYI